MLSRAREKTRGAYRAHTFLAHRGCDQDHRPSRLVIICVCSFGFDASLANGDSMWVYLYLYMLAPGSTLSRFRGSNKAISHQIIDRIFKFLFYLCQCAYNFTKSQKAKSSF
jgi:hypothetical protein